MPRVDVEILPPEVLAEGVENFELVGENSREVMERRPASVVIVTLRYKKFLRKGRDRAAEATESIRSVSPVRDDVSWRRLRRRHGNARAHQSCGVAEADRALE